MTDAHDGASFLDLTTDPVYWAKKYTDRGLFLIPLHAIVDGKCTCGKPACTDSRGKHPVWPNWPKRATPDFEIAKTWFRSPSGVGLAAQLATIAPPRNLGIATGHGIVVWDFDGEIGAESLRQLMAEHPDWPVGPVAKTGSGGLHFFFRTREDFPNSVGLIMPGLDVRSMGGQVVACPSIHKSGNRYGFLQIDGVCSFTGFEIPDLPDWAADMMRGRSAVVFDPGPWLERQAPAISGEAGSPQLMRVTAGLIRQGRVRTFERYEQVIAPWNARCVPSWDDKELARAFDNAFGRFQTEATIDLPVNKAGEVVCDRGALHRIVTTDPRYEFAFQFNTLTKEKSFNGAGLTDEVVTGIELEIVDRYRLRQLNRQWLRDSINASAHGRSFNPVVTYLEGLHWDGTPRLALLPELLAGEGATPLHERYLRKWAIGAVRRVFEPGCTLQTALILQGPQGIYKSSFFRTMFGEYFRDNFIDVSNKDSLQQIQTWGYEWAELENVTDRRSIDTVKAFLSIDTDTFRAPYDHLPKPHKRTCVIVGSTNRVGILADPTGDRRFWVIACRKRKIDIEWVRANRDQLWAEATAACRAKEIYWLTDSEEEARAKSNEGFTVDDPVYDMACTAVERLGRKALGPSGKGFLLWADLCDDIRQSPGVGGWAQRSIAKALQDAGWTNIQKKVGGINTKVWIKKDEGKPES